MRLVHVTWRDSYGCSTEWTAMSHLEETPADVLHCKSVGWVVQDSDDCIVVVPHISQEHPRAEGPQGCGDMTIPKCAIVRIVDLPEPEDTE